MTTTVPTDTTLDTLDLRDGDTIVIDHIEDGHATISLARKDARRPVKQTTRQFLEKWAGRFPVPSNPENDPRLASILEKHVK